MTPQRWEQIKELFDAALDRQPGARSAFLETACPGDDALRTEVEALLCEHDEASSFMERPVTDFVRRPIFTPGQWVANRYRIIRLIGKGGMGEVYEVEDGELHEHIALKTIRSEIAAHASAIEHFKREVNLAREPHVRFAKATDVMKVIGDSAGTTAMPAPVETVRTKPTIRSHGWRWLLGSGVALVIVLLALFAYRIHIAGKSSVPYASVLKHMAPLQPFTAGRSIAVLGFAADTADAQTAWLSAALTERFAKELAAGGALHATPNEKVARMKDDLSMADVDAYDREGLLRIREYLGADLVLLGSYKVTNDGLDQRIGLKFSLQDTAQGETLLTWTQNGRKTQWLDLVEHTGAWLRTQMATGEAATLEHAHARALLADFHFDPKSDQAIAAQPRWQRNLNWAIRNERDQESVDCPHKYFITYPECYFARGRACLMEKAMQSARENDCSNAYQLAQIAQCHNAPERDQIRDAGEAAVCDFLRNY